jgi:flagellar motor switch protein FliM
MDKSNVLSNEEIAALSKVTDQNPDDLTKLITDKMALEEDRGKLNTKALDNITELTWSECEKVYTSFIRKKVIVRPKEANFGKLSEMLEPKREKHIFSVFHLMPNNYFGLTVISLPLLHQAINLLYGGTASPKETIIESPGKIGMLVADKVAELAMEGFTYACKEFGTVKAEMIKTVVLPNLITKLAMDDEVYRMEYAMFFGEYETALTIIIPVEFWQKFIPVNSSDETNNAKTHRFWRKAIESQVVDSSIDLIVSLPQIMINAKDLFSLKEGDLIPIGDPTIVDVHLNDTRLFGAVAGQSNANRVIKITDDL